MRLAGFNVFQLYLDAKKVVFLDFNVMKIVENASIIRNSGILGGRVLLEDLRYLIRTKRQVCKYIS